MGKIKRRALLPGLLMATLTLMCASQVPPPGGPVDKTPPFIKESFPLSGSLNVDTRTNVEITFSKYMNKNSVENSVFISPNPRISPVMKWRGKKLRIRFPEELERDRTYVITVGAGARDLRNNSLGSSFTIAFSTGKMLDYGKISGRVWEEIAGKSIYVWAYLVAARESINVEEDIPDYITQPANDGRFKFSYLPSGRYLLFAIEDEDKDGAFNSTIDRIGIQMFESVVIDTPEMSFENCNFRLTGFDRKPLQIISAVSEGSKKLSVKFNKTLDLKSVRKSEFQIWSLSEAGSGGEREGVEIERIYPDFRDLSMLHFIVADISEGVEYEFTASGVEDTLGNWLDSLGSAVNFYPQSGADSTGPGIVHISPADKASNVSIKSKIKVFLDEPVIPDGFQENFALFDLSGDTVPGAFLWEWDNSVNYLPDDPLKSNTRYTIKIELGKISDIFGNPGMDTVMISSFKTVPVDTFGSISGRVFDPTVDGEGDVYILARQTETNGWPYRISIPDTGKFLLEDLLPGNYFIMSFRDLDNNGKYTFGYFFPFRKSEPFTIYSDTLRVRSRWENSGVELFLPQY